MNEVAVNKNLKALLENHDKVGTPAFKDIIVFEGSARSGKTWSILEYLINVLAQEKLVATCFRFNEATHTTSTVRDFKDIMRFDDYAGLWKEGNWNGQEKKFTFKNGSIMEFKGTSDAGKLHGPERDFAWLNELEHHYEAYRQIVARTRLMTLIDFNPSLSKHWLFDRVLTRSNCLYMHSTYKDNLMHLAQKIVDEIESTNPNVHENKISGTADEYFWNVYGLGLRAKREGSIFKFWEFCEPEDWPAQHLCQRHGYGMDFGYSADPTALVECALFQSRLYVREVFRERGLITCRSHANPNTRSIQGMLEDHGIKKNAKIVADSARPEQIAELNAEGYSVTSCKKYPGSIVAGIDLMKRTPLFVHRHSTDLHQELDQYAWKRKPDGQWTQEPEDRFNHGVDGIRYWVEDELKRMSIENPGKGRGRRARKLRRH